MIDLRSDSIIFQLASPGTRASQNRQPLTALPVIETAAEDGESYRLPLSTSAPDSTRAREVFHVALRGVRDTYLPARAPRRSLCDPDLDVLAQSSEDFHQSLNGKPVEPVTRQV